jgi:hypothetical protein
LVTGFRWLSALVVGLACTVLPATAATFDVKAAKKTCLDLYNAEKESGTIPAGMPKSKYVSQCTNSMRRSAELDKELAAQSTPAATTTTGGSNEIAVTTAGKPGSGQPRTSKPATVTTPAFTQSKGN